MKINLSKPYIGIEEANSAYLSVMSGWLTQNGSSVSAMEDSLTQYLQKITNSTDFISTTTSNGTTALHLALLAAEVRPGDEVIIPNFSYIAVANAVLYCNATPVFADVNLNNWNISSDEIRRHITNKTKAIIVVDNYGKEANFMDIEKNTPEHIKIIRDSCESFPFKKEDYPLRSSLVLSFYANKIITSGEGGAIFASSEQIENIKRIKNQGLFKNGSFEHSVLGYNYRLSNLHASIFNAQWEKRNFILSERNRIFCSYERELKEKFEHVESNFESTPWLFTFRIPGLKVESLRKRLWEKGIETRPGFTPFSKTNYLKQYSNNHYPNSNILHEELLAFPTYPELTDQEIEYIVEQFKESM